MKPDYKTFLASKHQTVTYSGFEVNADDLNPKMHPFQRDIVRWSLKLGKAAVFAAVGLGKTFMQLEWSRLVVVHTHKPVLVLAPLAVSAQTVREGKKFGIDVTYVADGDAVTDPGIYVTNYARLSKFDAAAFGGVVLDESSILKNFTGKTKHELIAKFANTDYKLACSATPAPNDHMEFGNHAEFLSVMPRDEMLMRWFTHDSGNTAVWRVKGHAQEDFWRWITSWAVCISKPSDLGERYEMDGYNLPPLEMISHSVRLTEETIARSQSEGRLMPDTRPSSTDLAKVKRESIPQRVEKVKAIVDSLPGNEPVNIWCFLNDEEKALAEALPDAVVVSGSDPAHVKEERLIGFSEGKYRILITKPKIAGMGMNWQHCANPIFMGVDYSFEAIHQAIGRNLRYGQTRTVRAHIVHAEAEGGVMDTIRRKQDDFDTMQTEMTAAMNRHGLFRDDQRLPLTMNSGTKSEGDNWALHLGDCVEVTRDLKDNSVDFSVYSPPFSNLFVYSDDVRDMGNSANDDEFFEHYKLLIDEMYRITTPGRLTAVHVSDTPMFKGKDGHAGIRDFSGGVVQAHIDAGWIYHSRITIWKDPVVEVTRTKTHGLLHKTFTKDASKCRVGMPDYILVFRKPGADKPVAQNRTADDYIGTHPPANPLDKADERRYSIEVWQRYASPVWFDINQTNVLNYRMAKDNHDEKHICPLQLDVIERCVDLWTNPGDVVFSPFAGIGSEGYSAIKLGRKFIGVELKPSYYAQACKYLAEAELAATQKTLFDLFPSDDQIDVS